MEPVKIYAGTNLHEDMPGPVLIDLFAWFRENGVEPTQVPMNREIVIGELIDLWWWASPKTPEPEGAYALERSFESGEVPLAHLQAPVRTPLPAELETALRDIQNRWDEKDAALRRQIYGINAPCPKCGHQR